MLLRRSTTLLILLIVMILQWMTKANSIELDCNNSDQLCPGTDSITIKCTLSTQYPVLKWEVLKGVQIDLSAGSSSGFESEFKDGVTFDAKLVNDTPKHYESTLTFNPSLATEKFSVTCYGAVQGVVDTCQVSFRDPPPAPINLSSHYLYDSSEVLLSWTPPPLNNTPTDLTYNITITPPTTTNDTLLFTTTGNHLALDASSFQRNVTYTVSINTMTCSNSLAGENSAHSSFIIPLLEPTTSSIIPSSVIAFTNTHSTSIHMTTSTSSTSSSSSSLSSSSSSSSLSSSSIASTQSPHSTSTESTTTTVSSIDSSNSDTATETDDNSHDGHDGFLYAVVGGIGGGVVVLIAITVILIAFSIIVVVIVRKITPSHSNCGSNEHRKEHSNDGTIRPPVQDLSPVVIINTPPPLPPRPSPRPNFELRAINSTNNPLYDNPEIVVRASKQTTTNNVQPQTTLFAEVECQQPYAIPIFSKIFLSKGNSKPFQV